MPTVLCPKCGATVRFEGIAGICPVCATVVKPSSTRSGSSTKTPPTPAAKPRRSSREPADLEGLDIEHDQHFGPPLTGDQDGKQQIDPLLLYLSAGAGAILLVFALYVVLRTFLTHPSVPIATAPPRPALPAVVQPQVDQPPPPPAEVIAPQTQPVVVTPAVSRPAWMGIKPVAPKLAVKPITDEAVGESITRAVNHLKGRFTNGELDKPDSDDVHAGTDALVVYSLLHAGEAISDSSLSVSDPFMQGLLDRLKRFDLSGQHATYCRALRASALAMFDREADAEQLEKDRKWLLDSEVAGAYTYTMPAKGALTDSGGWDNSNSQYGVLGIWAGVLAGISAPDKYWNDVEHHWLTNQRSDGGWSYNNSSGSSITMTCAGVTTLCVTAEQLELISSKGKRDAHPEMAQAVNKGVDWLGDGDRIVRFDSGNAGYTLYGIERAALATGYRWFGQHDWYRDLGAEVLKDQAPDGSWSDSAIETAFRVLFLSRGRQPIFMNKLRFDGDWNDRPRDAAKLTEYASKQLEKPFAWGVADLRRNWWDWMETPFLFISTDAAPVFSDEDCKKLRAYTDAGGMIFIHNEYASPEVDAFVYDLVRRAYPEYPLKLVPPDDLIYSAVFPIKVKPRLKAIGNGTRTFLVYSPTDITQDWVRYKARDSRQNPARQLGLNLFVEAAGKSDYRNRLNSPYQEPPDFDPIGTVPILQIAYPGPWNPEPKAYERFSRWFQNQTSIKLDLQTTKLLDVTPQQAPVAVLTGNAAVDFSKLDLHMLHDYVDAGGVLVIDSTGGNKAFADSVRDLLLPTAFPGILPTDIPASHPLLSGAGNCMDSLPKPHLRNYASLILNATAPNIQYATVGKGTIIVSSLDLTTGLLYSGNDGIVGYSPAYCQSIMKNVILWALSRYAQR